MANRPQRGILMGIALGASLAAASTPAAGFSLFGFHLWGEREDEDQIEIIDPLPYTVTMTVSGGPDNLQRTLEQASSLWTDRETPASGNAGLLSKARGDYRRILAALYGEGFYGPTISIRAAGQEVADVTLAVQFPHEVPIVIAVTAGPRFRFGETDIINAPPPRANDRDPVETPKSAGFTPGATARSGVINQASALSIERWRQLSRAKAKEADREVIADHATSNLDVTLTLDPGQEAHYGKTVVRGSRRTDPAFIAFMADLPEGEPFDPDDIAAGQDRLNRLGAFNAVRFVEADAIGPDGSLPITVVVEDRRPRSVGVGGTLSTIDGIGIATYWQHRNLFGRGERLRFDASVDGLGDSLDPNNFDYNVGVTFTKPGVWTPDTNFVTGIVAQQVDFDTYREKSITASAGLSQTFGRRLTGDAFLQVSRARYEDDFGIRHFTIFGLIGRAAVRPAQRSAERHPRLLPRRRGAALLRVRRMAIPRSAARSTAGSTRASARTTRSCWPAARWSAPSPAPTSPRARRTCCSSPAAAARCAATPTTRSASRPSSFPARTW